MPWNTLKGKILPDPTIFIIFLWKILSQTSKCPRTPLFFIILVGKHCPRPHIWLRLPRTPLYFFPDQKFCPNLVWGIVTLLPFILYITCLHNWEKVCWSETESGSWLCMIPRNGAVCIFLVTMTTNFIKQ